MPSRKSKSSFLKTLKHVVCSVLSKLLFYLLCIPYFMSLYYWPQYLVKLDFGEALRLGAPIPFLTIVMLVLGFGVHVDLLTRFGIIGKARKRQSLADMIPEHIRREYRGQQRFSREHRRLRRGLHSPDPDHHRECFERLLEAGPQVLPMLIYHCHEPETRGTQYRESIVKLIDQLHPEGLVPALVAALEDPNANFCTLSRVSGVLGDLKKSASPAVPALINIERRDLRGFSGDGFKAIKKIGPGAVPALAEVLRDPNESSEFKERVGAVLREMESALTRKRPMVASGDGASSDRVDPDESPMES